MGGERPGHPVLVGAGPFLVLLGLVALLARAQSLETKGPWFSAPVTEAVYAITLLAAVALLVATTAIGILRSWMLDDKVQAFDLQLALVRSVLGEAASVGSPGTTASPSSVRRSHRLGIVMTSEPGPPRIVIEPSAVDGGPAEGSVPVSVDPDGNLGLDFPDGNAGSPSSRQSLKEAEHAIAAARTSDADARDAIWPTLAGPLLAEVAFVAIAGTMLPGSGGFLAVNFELNTMLILFLSYGWWLVVAWFVFAVVRLRRVVRRPRSSAGAA